MILCNVSLKFVWQKCDTFELCDDWLDNKCFQEVIFHESDVAEAMIVMYCKM